MIISRLHKPDFLARLLLAFSILLLAISEKSLASSSLTNVTMIDQVYVNNNRSKLTCHIFTVYVKLKALVNNQKKSSKITYKLCGCMFLMDHDISSSICKQKENKETIISTHCS